MKSKWFIRVLGAGLAVTAVAAVTAVTAAAAGAATINGDGSTLIAPLEAEWASAFAAQNSGNTINYNPTGSGQGLTDISHGVVDFAGSDAPLSASSTSCSGCLQMPWALTATGIGFHVNGIRSLRLTGSVLAQIYMGQIKNWNDSRIKKLQKKGVRLPSLPISVFFRSDGSGDTYAFTDYLSNVSGSFRGSVGNGTTVHFPVGTGAKGNSGMVQALQQTNGSIAYVAVSYLIADWPRVVALKNAAGNYEVPNYSNIQNAAQSRGSLGANNEVHLVNPPGRYKVAYPIATYTYVITRPGDPNNGLVKSFINYALGSGQALGPRLGFVPIPAFVKNADLSTLNNLH